MTEYYNFKDRIDNLLLWQRIEDLVEGQLDCSLLLAWTWIYIEDSFSNIYRRLINKENIKLHRCNVILRYLIEYFFEQQIILLNQFKPMYKIYTVFFFIGEQNIHRLKFRTTVIKTVLKNSIVAKSIVKDETQTNLPFISQTNLIFFW